MPQGRLSPDAVVIVATVRALKMHGGLAKTQLGTKDLEALEKGLPNLLKHIENITQNFGLPAVVAINRFPQMTRRSWPWWRNGAGSWESM